MTDDITEAKRGRRTGQVKAGGLYLPFVPQHVVFAEVGVDQVALLIQLLHHLHGKTARMKRNLILTETSAGERNENKEADFLWAYVRGGLGSRRSSGPLSSAWRL